MEPMIPFVGQRSASIVIPAVLIACGLVIAIWTLFGPNQRRLWDRPVQVAAVICVLGGAADLGYSRLMPLYGYVDWIAPLLNLGLHVPGLLVVAYLAYHSVGSVAGVVGLDGGRVLTLLRRAPQVTGLCFAAMVAVALTNPDQAPDLETALGPWAFAYRLILSVPIFLYSALIVRLYVRSSARLRHDDPAMGRRYLFFAAGAVCWSLVALNIFGAPFLALGMRPTAADYLLYGVRPTVEAFLIVVMAGCFMYGFLHPYARSKTERTIAVARRYHAVSEKLSLKLRGFRDRSESIFPGSLGIVDELQEGLALLGADPSEERNAITTLKLVVLIRMGAPLDEAAAERVSSQLLLRLYLYQRFLCARLCPSSPLHQSVAGDPIPPLRDRVARLIDDKTAPQLVGDEAWYQYTAVVLAAAGFFSSPVCKELLEPKQHLVSQDVLRVHQQVRFEGDRPAY